MWNIWHSELRMTIRQRSFYSFLVLWVAVLSLLFLVQSSAPSLSGYTNMTGTVVNVALYIIPLFMLIIGSFSIANEMENGQWRLLNTYPLFSMSYISGKIGGQFTAQAIVFTFSYGVSLAIGLVSGNGFSSEWLLSIYFFSMSLIFFFLVLGITLGCIVSTRWQALSISVIIWFFLIMIWPTALIGVLGLVPYPWIAPLMKLALVANPAEFIRVSLVINLDGGAVFGQAYDSLVPFLDPPYGILNYILYFIGFMAIMLLFSMLMLEWRKRR
ncbi:ABC transporter permease [Peribacillus huizhouensis]|uniref:Cu-processing system permease protein n=1 Tax=Peribacillus huizhouensis TaxID=1501239 RepID=A0ABR6CNP6_9BACI|nr:ABC transporter permease subunit [Peribacillus huizhouensis]MBA9026561.1 Cu-processing system permease protein [Peribacillus huizhouensis]